MRDEHLLDWYGADLVHGHRVRYSVALPSIISVTCKGGNPFMLQKPLR